MDLLNKYILVLVVFLLLCKTDIAAKEHGLVIAISAYPQASGWPSLASDNDVEHMRLAFLRLGIDGSDIRELKNDQATYSSIISELNKLYNRVLPGDKVFLHFSGHGQPVIDINDDEVDGLDEALVPYDAPKGYQPGEYEGERHLLDDTIAQFNRRLRTKLGKTGQLIWTIDACHSGTATRGIESHYRGTHLIMGSKQISNERTTAVKETVFGFDTEANSDLAPYVCFSASAAHEKNIETIDDNDKPIGSLSYAFSKAIGSADNRMNALEIYSVIRSNMKEYAPFQRPQIEGDLNLDLGNAQSNKSGNSYTILDHSNTEVLINAGAINGVYTGSKIAIVSYSTDGTVVSGIVSKADLAQSIVTLDFSLPEFSESDGMYAVITSKATSSNKCNVQYVGFSQDPVLKKELSGLDFINWTDCNPHIFIEEHPKSIKIIDKHSYEIASIDRSISYSNQSEQIADYLLTFALNQEVKNYKKKSTRFQGKVQFLDSMGTEIDINTNDLYLGQNIEIKVTNTGTAAFYFALLDMRSDYIVQPVLPNQDNRATDLYLKPGTSWTIKGLKVSGATGPQILKLFMNREPLNWVLSAFEGLNIASSRGSNMDSMDNSLMETTYCDNVHFTISPR